jgi:hypothetical protein
MLLSSFTVVLSQAEACLTGDCRKQAWVLKNSVPEAILYGAGVVLLSFLLFF